MLLKMMIDAALLAVDQRNRAAKALRLLGTTPSNPD